MAQQTEPADAQATPPRIVQIVDDNAASELSLLFRLPAQVLVALDDRGQLWSYGKGEADSLTYGWHHLPLPPLLEGEPTP
jgi:hypothetical protein